MRKSVLIVIVSCVGVGCQTGKLKWGNAGSDGSALFAKHCASCHEPAGDAGTLRNPGAAPFDGNAELGGQSDEHLFGVIKSGGGANKRSPQMHAFGSGLSDEQIRELVSYLRRKVEKP